MKEIPKDKDFTYWLSRPVVERLRGNLTGMPIASRNAWIKQY